MVPTSAIPDVYYAIFAFYEPFLCIVGMLATFADPKTAHNTQATWSLNNPPPDSLSPATLITTLQLGHVCGLLGLVNIFVLTAARRYCASHPALQEKMVGSLLTPLLIGDFTHLFVTFWGLGEDRWIVSEWGGMTWSALGFGVTLMIPRILWWLGVGRYVEIRDGMIARKPSASAVPVKN